MKFGTQALVKVYCRLEMAQAHHCFDPGIPAALHERCSRVMSWMGPITANIVHRVAMNNIDDINIMHVRRDMPASGHLTDASTVCITACHRIAELETALRAMFDNYEGVYDMAIPHQHQSESAKHAERLARDALGIQ